MDEKRATDDSRLSDRLGKRLNNRPDSSWLNNRLGNGLANRLGNGLNHQPSELLSNRLDHPVSPAAGNSRASNSVAGNSVAGNSVAGNSVAGNSVAGNSVAGNSMVAHPPAGNARGRRRLAAFGVLLALPLLIAGCGAASEETVTPVAQKTTPATAETNLTIVVKVDDKTTTWTLTCDPPGGTHPTPDKACAALAAKGKTALPPVPKDMMCTQIYGGSQTATITGTWLGEPVNASFSRRNGCEISRWQDLEGLLPTTAEAPSTIPPSATPSAS